jgi:hypothetical protein
MAHLLALTAVSLLAASASLADGTDALHQVGAILSGADSDKVTSLDILAAHAHRDGNKVTFHMTTNGTAGTDPAVAVRQMAGAPATLYVWPTSLDPSTVGFEGGTGILSLAAATHPYFDDTPLFDKNADGNVDNDSGHWHYHWAILTPTPECGDGALAVRDIPEGANPKLPATWPGLPIFFDSPGVIPVFDGPEVVINVSFANGVDLSNGAYDGFTTALRVNKDIHAPVLCVTDVFDIASGDLSLPGKIE